MKSGYHAVVLPDVHVTVDGVKPAYEVVKRFIKRVKPDKIVLAGDFAECEPLSHWLLSKKVRLKKQSHREEVDMIAKELDYLQKYCGEIIWLEGNHERWVELYLEEHPEMQNEIEYQNMLDLEGRGIKWVPHHDLYWLGKLAVTHGLYLGENHAKKHLMSYGCNIMYGHTHRSDMHTMNMVMQPTIKAWGLSCLCGKKPHFMKNKPAKWDEGFGDVYVADNGEFNAYIVDIINNRFYHNGKSYT